MFGKVMSIVGGVGLGAGLLYLLDPESGNKRRRQIMRSLEDLGSGIADRASGLWHSAGDTAGSAYGTLTSAVGSAGSAASKYIGQGRDYAAEKGQDARRYAIESLGGEMPHSHKLGMTICALSSMAMGAALMYVFDPKNGQNRRAAAQTYAKEHLEGVTKAVNTGYRAVADKVSSGYESVSGAVTHLAAKVGIGSGTGDGAVAEAAEAKNASSDGNASGKSKSRTGTDRSGGTAMM